MLDSKRVLIRTPGTFVLGAKHISNPFGAGSKTHLESRCWAVLICYRVGEFIADLSVDNV